MNVMGHSFPMEATKTRPSVTAIAIHLHFCNTTRLFALLFLPRLRSTQQMESLWVLAQSCRATLTIATIPAFTAAGNVSQAATTVARSSGMACTHSAHFSCKNMSFWCVECVIACGDSLLGES